MEYKSVSSLVMEKLSKIKILALDFDGTLTDGYVYTDNKGKETVRCSRKDSMGINMVQNHWIGVVVISSEENYVVKARCDKLKIDCYYGVANSKEKLRILASYAYRNGILLDEVAYIGDDVNDLYCLKSVGVGITVADGHPSCKAVADYITERKGGEHAVREVCDLILKAKGVGK